MSRKYVRRVSVSQKNKPEEEMLRIAPYRVEQDFDARSENLFAFVDVAAFASIWSVTKGEGIKIAVLDTGVAFHSALEPSINRTASRNFTGDGNGIHDVDDKVGHGTHVAGIIAAQENIGVAPKAELYIGKVMRHLAGGSVDALVDGIEWAVEQKVNIINLSMGSLKDTNEKMLNALKAVSNEIFVVCAAGNGGSEGLDFPAKYEQCIAVGALNAAGDRRWKGDSAGEGESAVGKELDLMARGESVRSTLLNGRLGKLSGTSMAAPFVTGVLALALSKPLVRPVIAPIKTRQDLKNRLPLIAKDLGQAEHDNEFGFGVIEPQTLFNSV